MATKSKTRKRSVVRGKAATATRKTAKRTVHRTKKKTKKSARTAKASAKATRKAKVVKAVVVKAVARKKPVARKSPAVSGKRSPSPRIVRAAMTVKQIPRAQQSYAVMPKPVAAEEEPAVELVVPEVVVSASVQGEVPAGGE